nr:acyltransferase [Terriglobus roseus]
MVHQFPAPSEAAPKQFLFVDAVRFWSMLAVVALHSTQWIVSKPSEGIFPLAAECLFKYGTISFFLISGFLLGNRIDTAAPLPYLSRRLKTLLVPWTFWFGLYVLYLIVGDFGHRRIVSLSLVSWADMVLTDVWIAAFSTSFWFVPNLALGLCILVLFRRYLHHAGLGVALFSINFLYVLNIYKEWFPPRHTYALFAFVSFLWLGSFAAQNFSRVSRVLDGVPMPVIVALAGLSYAGTIVEVQILTARHSVDPLNTLRLSNQVFSTLLVLLIVRLKSASWPGFIRVREQTFAIYLTHTIFLRAGSFPLNHWIRPGFVEESGPAMSFLLRALLFIFAYGGSLLLGRWISTRDRWRWTIGLKPRAASAQTGRALAGEEVPTFG